MGSRDADNLRGVGREMGPSHSHQGEEGRMVSTVLQRFLRVPF
jgi:hypothetical protein